MAKKFFKPYPLVYFLSLFFGLLLIFFIIISFLNFSKGNVFFGLTLFSLSFFLLSSFTAWVDKVEELSEKEESEKGLKSKLSLKGRKI
jgi:hypothetical protein